ncbi:MAG: hypothetical protein ACYTGZ_22685, partial [Planctomycetota bacterium]
MKRIVVLSFVVAAAFVVAGVAPMDAVEAKAGVKVRTHLCEYCVHGSLADRIRHGKPPGTPGNGGGGGGKGSDSCSKTFGEWKNVTNLDVYIDGSGGPAGISAADFEKYAKLAFDEWDCHSGIGESVTITYVGSAGAADITIGWGNLGNDGILGVARTATRGKSIRSSSIEMNSNQQAFTWTLGATPQKDA